MLVYTIVFGSCIWRANIINLINLRELGSSNLNTRLLVGIRLLGLGGVPPMSGFYLKLIALKSIYLVYPLLAIVLLSLSLLTLYLFLQVIIYSCTAKTHNHGNNIKNNRIIMIMSVLPQPLRALC